MRAAGQTMATADISAAKVTIAITRNGVSENVIIYLSNFSLCAPAGTRASNTQGNLNQSLA